jgi:hypothetical protein
MRALSHASEEKLWARLEGQIETFKQYKNEISSGRMRINY